MNQIAIFWPMLAQVLLVYLVYGVLGARRKQARDSGIRLSQFKTRSAEPDVSVTAANNVINQFELPVLFYAVCISLYVTAGVTFVVVALAWLFVVLRYVHAFIHLTSNRVQYRGLVFIAGWFVLAFLWIFFAVGLLTL